MRVLVAGGGIGGLAAAIGLAAAGHDVDVFEEAVEFQPVGYGIALSPNALQALEHLGVAEELRALGARADKVRIRRWDGRVLSEVDVAALGWEMLGIHRADLQRVLRNAAGDAVHFGQRAVRFRTEGDAVVLELANGTDARGDVLVGADGIDSIVRTQLHGPGEKRYAGHAGWRASTSLEPRETRGAMSESWGPRERFGLVPIGAGRLYWFVAEIGPPNRPPPTGVKAMFLERFRDWHSPIVATIESSDEHAISKTDVYDRVPLERWGEGRVTLLGDAAHPMTPNLGQGAAQALEDAVVLANRLRDTQDVEAALRAYEGQRVPRTTEIVKRSWQFGRLAQVSHPIGRRLRDTLVRATPTRIQRAQQERVIRVSLD